MTATPIDVLTFGAAVDGVTDDQAAIQAAIDEAEARGGGVVLLGAGVSIIGNGGTSGGNAHGLLLKSNVHLQGRGQFVSELKTKDSNTGALVTTSFTTPSEKISISDLSLNGNRSGGVSNYLGMNLWPYRVTNLSMENIYSYDSAVFSVRPQEVENFSFKNLIIDSTTTANGSDCFHMIDCRYGYIDGVRAIGYGDDIFVFEAENFDCHDIVAKNLIISGLLSASASNEGVSIFNRHASATRKIYNLDITGVTSSCKTAGLGISTRGGGDLDAYNIRANIQDDGSKQAMALNAEGKIHNCEFNIASANAKASPIMTVVSGLKKIEDNTLNLSVYNPGDGYQGTALYGTRWNADIKINYDPLGNKVSPSLGLDVFADTSHIKSSILGGSHNIFVRAGASYNTFEISSLSDGLNGSIYNNAGAVKNSFVGGKVTGAVTDNDGTARFYGSPSFEGYGTANVTTNSSGNANIAHGLIGTPRSVSVSILGDVAHQVDVQSVDATNILVRLKNPANNADVATTRTIMWAARL